MTIMSMYIEREKDKIKDTCIEREREKKTDRDRQTKKERNTVALATILFMSLTSSLSPGPSSTLLCRLFFFSFVSPSISHTNAQAIWMTESSTSSPCTESFFSLSVYCYHFPFLSWTTQPLLLFSCPYLQSFIALYSLYYVLFFSCSFVKECHSKPVWIFFFCGTQKKIFW